MGSDDSDTADDPVKPRERYAAPVVPAAMELADDDVLGHLVRKEDQLRPLAIRIEEIWADYDTAPPGFDTKVEFLWRGVVVETFTFPQPVIPDDVIPVVCTMPSDYMAAPGSARVEYRVTVTVNPSLSHATHLFIDKQAPNGDEEGKPLQFDQEVLINGVTEDYLSRHDTVDARVVPWPDIRVGDLLMYYWEKLPVIETDEQSLELPYAGELRIIDVNAPIIVQYDAMLVRESGSGPHKAYYRLEDRTGNRGPKSEDQGLEVVLDELPGALPDPRVPRFDADGLIDLEDAQTGVEVHIDAITDAQAGDQVQAYWRGLPLRLITLSDNQQWPLRAPVSWAILAAGGFAAPFVDRVHYTWRRSGALLTSATLWVDVDLTVAGPPPGPDPVNPLLQPAVVKGLTADNVLTGADVGLDAHVEIRLYDNPQTGQVLELFWGSHLQAVDRYEVKAEDVGGQLIVLSVPWAIIHGVGNSPALPMQYTTFNGVNRQRSPVTPVRVEVRVIEGLAPATFPDADRNQWINCSNQPWLGVRVEIPKDSQFQVDDKITLHWEGDYGQIGNNPIPGTQASFEHVLTREDLESEQGYIFTVLPYDPLIKLAAREDGRGGGNVRYRLDKADGSGAGNSGLARARLSVLDLSTGLYCDPET
ncbi:hypothetical protein [Pseudomonas donghuensis]|uniref:Uncharacterized protein n=1 Tax=Pseudomonas donghuensis TaxID=1163398 RepID=A0AAP0SFB6_9PSED|nr:hypothetical protein [Pseudomonas donghuensis]KDN97638.1 hypothetical protein BV82_4497 [Pseudomonas donghuensis]MCP6690605.1 hypothetical protein [Pseudomonas donghuensis]MDF9895077.1 hypothetical protein [Pseudomonas vranovensis]